MGAAATAQNRQKNRNQPKDPSKVRRSLVLFPLDDATSATPIEDFALGDEVFSALSSRFSKIGAVFFSRFNRRHTSIMRSVAEGRLKAAQLDPPYNEEEGKYRRSVEIARELSVELVASGSIAGYSYNGETRTATITLAVDVLTVAANKPVVSAVATGTVTGSADEKAAATMAKAINQAADTIAQDVGNVLSGKAAPKKDAPAADGK